MMLFAVVITAVGNVFADILSDVFLTISIGLPDFEYRMDGLTEVGNETFTVYTQMRLISTILLTPLVLIGLALTVIENRKGEVGIASSAIFGKTVVKPLALMFLFASFPFFWDTGSETMENIALWILNPLYSFDHENPCPPDWTDEMIIDAYENSLYAKDGGTLFGWDVEKAEIVCRPDLKTNYLLKQITANTDLVDHDPADIVTTIVQIGLAAVTPLLTALTLGVAKAVVAIQLTIMAITVGIVLDVFVGVTIAALPLFAVMAMIPLSSKIATTFIELIPAMLIIPILTAILVVVGSGFVASIPETYEDAGGGPFGYHLIIAWIGSLGTIYLVVMLPIMLIKPIGDVYSMVHKHVTQAVQSATVVTSFGVRAAHSTMSDVQGQMGAGAGMRSVQSGSAGAPGMGAAIKDNLLSQLGRR